MASQERSSSEHSSGSAAGVPHPPAGLPGAWDEPELQKIWLSMQAQEWRSLALVPASRKVAVIELARAFSAAGLRQRGESIGVADLRDVSLPNVRGHIEVVRWHINRGERVIIALRSCFENAATIPIVRVADCAILCVALGATLVAEASATIEQAGRDRFMGTVIVPPSAPRPLDSIANASKRLKA
jgi:hypothetical protein